MLFKTDKQEIDWINSKLDPRLRTIIYAADGFSRQHFGKEVVITDIHRLRDEQIQIYNDRGILNINNSPISVHEVWRGIDLRSSIYDITERRRLIDFLDKRFEYTCDKKTAIIHKIGDGRFHFHIQVDMDGETILRR